MVKRILLPALMLVFFAGAAFSQSATVNWDKHGLGFKVPSDFKVQTNSVDQFSASNDQLQLSVTPITNQELNADQLTEAAVYRAYKLGCPKVTMAKMVEADNFIGSYVEGKNAGKNVIVMTMLDTKTNTSKALVLNYADGGYDQAISIVTGFHASK